MPYPNDRERCACRCGEIVEGRADVNTYDGDVYIRGHENEEAEQAFVRESNEAYADKLRRES